MHDYMRAIGFSHEFTRDNFKRLLSKIVTEANYRNATAAKNEVVQVEYRKFFGRDIGLIMRGTLEATAQGSEEIFADETIPFLRATTISSTEKIVFRRKMDKESYIGVCDDYRLGMPLKFHLQNRNDYLSEMDDIENNPIDILHLSLSALSLDGMVMIPIEKNISDKEAEKKRNKRDRMMRMAHLGDERSKEDMVIEDMDTYTILCEKSKSEDVYSLVDSYFMPTEIECDEYAVLGEIKDVSEDINSITGEEVWIMDIVANGLLFSVCIHKDDLLGEPEIGRRFKGTVWMQGSVAF